MALDFNNKVVIVTGSSAGIGEATAYEFVKLGAQVVITGRNEEKLKLVEKKCQELTTNSAKKCVLAVVADVTKDEDLERLVNSTLNEFGQIDVLVNNAGGGSLTSIFDPNVVSAYEYVMNLNLRSVFVLTHKVVPHLIKTKGNIVNISSIAGTKPGGNFSAYCMSKAALDMFTRCLALEVGPHGVRVNCIKPALVKTNIFSTMGLSQEQEDKMMEEQTKHYPLRRAASSSDMADLIVFLASSKSVNMTGSLVTSDGGATWASLPDLF